MTLINIIFTAEFLEQLLSKWSLLLLIGLAFLLPLRAGFVNLGLSAQLIATALAMCFVAAYTESTFTAILAGLLASLIFGIFPIWLWHKFKANDILTTLFLVYITISSAQFILSSTSDSLAVATPTIPKAAEIGVNILIIQLLTLICVLIAWIYLNHTTIGYKTRVIANNPKTLSSKERFKIVAIAAVLSSIFITLAVLSDVYISKGRYDSGDYDTVGFAGVVVALLALRKPILTFVSALIVGFLEMLFLLLSVFYKIPQMGAHILYGVGILFAAGLLIKKGEKTY